MLGLLAVWLALCKGGLDGDNPTYLVRISLLLAVMRNLYSCPSCSITSSRSLLNNALLVMR